MSLVSIIIPVYNGRNYISRGLQSIRKQTYRDIEVIIVNDGAEDDSEAVISRQIQGMSDTGVIFKYISQENGGIANARNRGLEEASGDYVMFMDQDDWLEADLVETLADELEKTGSDLVIGGFKLVDSNGRIKENWKLNEKQEWSKLRITAPWGRMFRRSVIEDNHLRFMDTSISEDLYFNLLFMSYTLQIRVVSYGGYNWLYHTDSESRTRWSVMSPDRNPLIMLDELHRRMKVRNFVREDLLIYFFVKYIIWYLLYAARKSQGKIYTSMYDQCMRWLQDNYPGWSRKSICKWKKPGGEAIKTYLVVMGCTWMYKCKLLYPVLYLYHKI